MARAPKAERDRAYADAMRRLHEKYPDDLDAAAFYGLALLGTCEDHRDFATYMKAAAVPKRSSRRTRSIPAPRTT